MPSRQQSPAVRFVIAAAFVCIFAYSFASSLTNLLLNEVIDAFALTGTGQGLMSSLVNTGLMIALLMAPLFQGRVSKPVMLVAGCLIQAAMLVLYGATSMFGLFGFACILLGAGGGLADTYCNSIISDVGGERKGKYLGYLHGLFGVGSLLCPLLLRTLAGWMHWRQSMYVLAGGMLLAAVAIALLSRKGENGSPVPAMVESKLCRADLVEYMSNRRNVGLMLTGALYSAFLTGLMVWTVRYMTVRFAAPGMGALSMSVFWVCATANRFFVAHLKTEPFRLLIGGALLSALWLVIGIVGDSPVLLCVMMGAIGLSSGHFMQVLFGECAVGYEGKTTFSTSVLMVVMGVMRILVPLAMAYVSTSISVMGGMLLPAAAALLTAVAGWWTVKTSKKGC